MVLIREKRIAFVFIMTFISMFAYMSLSMSQNTYIETTATPVIGKTIIIDAGHGIPDGGCVGTNGTVESEINFKIALRIQKLIEESGNKCIMTRTDENGISGLIDATIRQKHVTDLRNRVKIGNESGADVFVSIHLNKISQIQYYGWQTFYKKDNEQSQKLAKTIQKAIGQTIEKENKREVAKISGVYIVDNVKIPISIVECGFLSNVEEERLLNTDEYQQKLALRNF